MATNQINVNVYRINASEDGLPIAMDFPATGFQARAVISDTGYYTTSAGVKCYGIIQRNGDNFFVMRTPAELQSLTNA